jgi:hypothetical protein
MDAINWPSFDGMPVDAYWLLSGLKTCILRTGTRPRLLVPPELALAIAEATPCDSVKLMAALKGYEIIQIEDRPLTFSWTPAFT